LETLVWYLEVFILKVAQGGGGDLEVRGGTWSISINAAFGGGFNLEFGRVWENKGGSKWYFSVGPSIGIDGSIGILSKKIYSSDFSVNAYDGYNSSIHFALGPLDALIGGDNYKSTWKTKFGRNYGENGFGLSIGFPIGAVWNMGKTWVFGKDN